MLKFPFRLLYLKRNEKFSPPQSCFTSYLSKMSGCHEHVMINILIVEEQQKINIIPFYLVQRSSIALSWVDRFWVKLYLMEIPGRYTFSWSIRQTVPPTVKHSCPHNINCIGNYFLHKKTVTVKELNYACWIFIFIITIDLNVPI